MQIIFDQRGLEQDPKANHNRSFQRCTLSVLDTIADPNITFDKDGVCNYYQEYLAAEKQFVFKGKDGKEKLAQDIQKIKTHSKGKPYDCIIGLSGGVDSTYLCLLAKEQGLRPLVVHCDNGWNSELAQHNIEQTIKRLGFDLFTYVINWEEFRELQLSYLKASVVDIEVLTDHAFMAVLYEQARKRKIKYVLAGMNIVTEQVLPSHWVYSKGDAINIKDIQRRFGNIPLRSIKTFPFLNYTTKRYCTEVLKMEVIVPLNYVNYVYDDVRERIKAELDWRDYGGKHYESVWTRFYQGYILPAKFHIDKRKAHLSNLIFSGQMTRELALETLQQQPYPQSLLEEDLSFVVKKFGLTKAEFESIMRQKRREHNEFEVQKGFYQSFPILKTLRPIIKAFQKIKG
ncbi:MAG: N-acetyl sugar amidotransferase [Cyanothece sp. SIO1E1]|nr:N-acetyl sugar amidotransferase [Cyanothece sp. SIO1E1]